MAEKKKSTLAPAPAGPKLSITHKGVRYDDPDKATINRILAAQNEELAVARKAVTAQAERPEWIDETPDQNEEYTLSMWDNSEELQRIDLTREEFIALKAVLAVRRGFQPEPEQAAPEAKAA
jgi:hypothetical protein